MNVSICSREKAEEMIRTGFPKNTAVISFSDPIMKRTPKEYKPLDYKGSCSHCFYVAVHDIDVDILGDYGLCIETYLSEAESIAKFIRHVHDDGMDIICQCEYGQSRSAACAAAILEYYEHRGIDVFADYRYYPNQLVFNKILEALRRTE